jgi:hypothetical protein
MFMEGPDEFKGGLSAGNYSTITGTSAVATNHDLADLVACARFAQLNANTHATCSAFLAPEAHVPHDHRS